MPPETRRPAAQHLERRRQVQLRRCTIAVDSRQTRALRHLPHQREQMPPTSRDPHLSAGERALSVALGLGLAAAATKPRPNPLLNVLALAAGAALAYRGASGYCHLKAKLAENESYRDWLPGGRGEHERYASGRPGYAPPTSDPRVSDYGPDRLPTPAPHGPTIPSSI